jgi:decaprenylphospho-beta-D-ribofuranose 2-oxidase
MSPADTLRRRSAGPIPERVTLTGWGRGPRSPGWLLSPADGDALAAAIAPGLDGRPAGGNSLGARNGAIARGMGRSYGDAAQLTDGLVLDMTHLRGHRLDADAGCVTAWAGETIGELLRALIPRGWMLPVVPGTQHVTMGGAIASDVHGKNHPLQGGFGRHVTALGLLLSTGEVVELAPGDANGRFEATVGGMGLTGVIVWATIALRALTTTRLSIDTERTRDLDETLVALGRDGAEYRIAWLDLLAPRGPRGIVTRASHRPSGDPSRPPAAHARFSIPARWPGGVLRPSLVRAFNARRFAGAPRDERQRPGDYGAEMFPLDAVDDWPRLYGSPGLAQYQFAVPLGRERVIERVIDRVRRSRTPCYLATLKQLGPEGASPLSFPLAGWTLAMDMPRASPDLAPLVAGLDELVAEEGGRVYLTKDALLTPDAVAAMYPRLGGWQRSRDAMDPGGVWRSDLALRTRLVAAR